MTNVFLAHAMNVMNYDVDKNVLYILIRDRFMHPVYDDHGYKNNYCRSIFNIAGEWL